MTANGMTSVNVYPQEDADKNPVRDTIPDEKWTWR